MKLDSMLFATQGEHRFVFEGTMGQLEGWIRVPSNVQSNTVAMLGHPHPLHGGSMTNKVVTTLARAFADEGIPSICFNFRGVGQSAGEYDAGIGESEDMLLLMKMIQQHFPEMQWILAGFSFGSYVVFRAAQQITPRLLLMVAPPVMRYEYHAQPTFNVPWWIFQGDADEVVEPEQVIAFVQQQHSPVSLVIVEAAGHFFHGQLLKLREKVRAILAPN